MRLFAFGRLLHYPRRSWERVLSRTGSKFAKRIQDADVAVVGGGAAGWPLPRLQASLEKADRLGIPVLGERAALRRAGVLPPLPDEARPYHLEELARRSGLTLQTTRLLALFEVIEGVDERFGFRAMKAAKAAAHLLTTASIADIVAACHSVRSAFNVAEPLSELQLTAEHGRIVLSAGGRIADLDGQLRLELQLPLPDVDALLASAEEARDAGHDGLAERGLRQALAASPRDSDVLFELGSLLCEREEFSEGTALLRKATRFHPTFADAWYNLGHALERQRLLPDAREAYAKAITADGNYADPQFNLGMLCLDDRNYAEAIERLQIYLSLDPKSGWAEKARKAIALARLSLMHAAAG
jgi:Flp pilus assembly protein TadD